MKAAVMMGLGFMGLASAIAWAQGPGGSGGSQEGNRPWENRKREVQDRIGGLPPEILKLQSNVKIRPPSIDEAIKVARLAARARALPLIDRAYHKGRRLLVPKDHVSIQGAIEAAQRGDIVVVMPGTYYEQLVMKPGVKLVSDDADDGNSLVAIPGAKIQLPRRTLRTIIDGSKSKPSHHGMIDFGPGVGRQTIVDGFTIQKLPEQDHHVPGHAHGLNVRGASPVIMNCYIRKNGSTGIGNHVVFKDQGSPISKRDFRWANVAYKAEAVIYNNIIRDSLGLGIGCNHFSAPRVLGNEVFHNSEEPGARPTPGMGAKHGAGPIIVGNLVHDNPGGGILSRTGKPQGAHPIDKPTHSTVARNVVYSNGKVRPGISCGGGGSMQQPIRFIGNFVYDAGLVGIGLSNHSVAIIEGNLVAGSGAPGISINEATALKLNHNRVTRAKGPGFVIINDAKVLEMIENSADGNLGPRFLQRAGRSGDKKK